MSVKWASNARRHGDVASTLQVVQARKSLALGERLTISRLSGFAGRLLLAAHETRRNIVRVETIAQLNRSLAARYRIDREIGSGGMATVYAAEDVKHGRSVALKVLKPDLGALLGIDRFLREIRVTATLQHPNLLPLFDSGDAEGALYYVMPLVEGESLRARLERELQLPVDEVVRIASAVASALEYAHGRGVIHRDLKPENILLHGGEPLVADFGIALAVSKAGGERVTQTGLSLGTPRYMSPEQATGDRVIDARTDIYSLGAVVYEMLTGEPPHSGGTAQALVARILTDRPRSVRTLRASVPEHVALAVDKALEKVPADRWSSARQFADALSGRLRIESTVSAGTRADSEAARSRVRPGTLVLTVTAIVLAIVSAVGWWRATRSLQEPVIGFAMGLPPDVFMAYGWDFPIAISPDGRTIAFVGEKGREKQLYLKRSEEAHAYAVAGTAGASAPTFSPDGGSLAFIANGQLRRMPVNGGSSVEIQSGKLATQGWPRLTASWTKPNTIVVTPIRGSGLRPVIHTVSALGGTPVAVTRLDSSANEAAQRWPVALDDGKTVLYTSYPAGNDMSTARLGVASLATGRAVRLDVKAVRALGMVDDFLIFVTAAGELRAVRVDLERGQLRGEPITLIEGVKIAGGGPVAAALSPNGTLIYVAGNSREQQLTLIDRTGAKRHIGERRDYDVVRAAPNGRFIAADIDGVSSDVWIYDLEAGTLSPLKANGDRYDPSWSPDSRWVYYVAYGKTADSLFRRAADGSGSEMFVAVTPEQYALDPTATTLLLYSGPNSEKGVKPARVRRLEGDTTTRELPGSSGHEYAFRFSPDGRWLAMVSDESGRSQVHVRPVSAPSPRVQVSTAQGGEPVWSVDGKELFYRDGENFIAAELDFSGGAVVKRRTTLFPDEYDVWGDPAQYDVLRDGRFVAVSHGNERDQVIVIRNWRDQVRARLRGSH